jgi:hypothetical protein
MAISKEERKAYEDGRKEAEYIKNNPLGYLLTGGIRSRPSDPAKAAAYDKGLKEKRLDVDKGASKSSSGKGGCYLTTACVEYAGLSDDCPELKTMRRFRDEYILHLPEAATLIEDYYRTAPGIVEQIKSQDNSDKIFKGLLVSLRKVVSLIEVSHNAEALELCKREFNYLKRNMGINERPLHSKKPTNIHLEVNAE